MDYRTITSLMLRIAGTLILVHLAIEIPHTITNLLHFGGDHPGVLETALWTAVFASLLPLAIGFALIYFPAVIVNRIVWPADEGQSFDVAAVVQVAAYSTLGIYFICDSLYDGAYWFSKLRLYYDYLGREQWAASAPAIMPAEFAGIVSTSVKFVSGLVLLLGAKGFSDIITWIRG